MPLRAAGTHVRSSTNPAGLTSRAISKANRPAVIALCEAARAGFARAEEACRVTSRRRTTTRRRATRGRATASRRATASKVTGRGLARSRASDQDRMPGRWSATGSGPRTTARLVPGRRTPSVPPAPWVRAAEFAARPGSAGHPEPAGRTRHVRLPPVGSPASAGPRSAGPAELRSAEHVQFRPAARDRIRPAEPAGAARRARVRPAGCRRLRRGGGRRLPSVRRGRSNPFRLVRRWRPAGLR